jgi:hypothetical protein
MRQYRIGDLNTGKGYTIHASSPRVALNYVFGSHIEEFLHPGDEGDEQCLNLLVTDLGKSVEIQRVVEEVDQWEFNGGDPSTAWYGWPRTEEKRVLVADGIPEGWKQRRPRKEGTVVRRDTCGTCGARSPREESHKAHRS